MTHTNAKTTNKNLTFRDKETTIKSNKSSGGDVSSLNSGFFIGRYGEEKRWVGWKLEKRDGKDTKIPYSYKGGLASSTDENTWGTYNEVKAKFENVGIVFTADRQLLGIDIDKCLDPNNKRKIIGERKEAIQELIKTANTYTEFSPSQTGLHLFLELEEPLELTSNRKNNYEVYTVGRYFTFTGDIAGKEKEVRKVSKEEALKVLSVIGYPFKKEVEEVVIKPKAKIEVSLTDDEILRKMFASKNGSEIKKTYDGDITKYDDDESRADIGLCMHLAFWTGKNRTQIERIWMSSPLGQRQKTQSRSDYRERTISSACESVSETYEIPTMIKEVREQELELLTTIDKKGNVSYVMNVENISRILKYHDKFKGTIRYDIFTGDYEIFIDNEWTQFNDGITIDIQTKISILFPSFALVSQKMVEAGMIKSARDNSYNSALDYITSIEWDKKNRIDAWLSSAFNVENDEYHKKAGSNWLKGLVKRVISPGCKFDFVLVLEGEQGLGKSTALQILGDKWYVETTMAVDNKDFFMQLRKKMIVEFSEGEVLSKTEVKKMKAIITTQIDTYRPPYERFTIDVPRHCVFAMTTNQDEYLKDETGNRRWLPVACIGEINNNWLRENKDQLLAEAYYRVVELKETVWEMPKEETLAIQASRRIKDPNEDLVVDWYFNKLTDTDKNEGITTVQAYRDAICGGYMNKPLEKWMELSISGILRNALGLEARQCVRNGMRARRWFKIGAKLEDFPLTTPPTELEKLANELKF